MGPTDLLANEIARVRHGQDVTASDLADRLTPWLTHQRNEVAAAKARQLRGALTFLGPEELTPQAARILNQIADQWEGRHVVE